MDIPEPSTLSATDEQINGWRVALAQRLQDYDTIATPLCAKIKALEKQLTTKTAALVPQIRLLKALIKHSESYRYLTDNNQERTISPERDAALTARWGPYISEWYRCSFNERLADYDGFAALSWLNELKDWHRHPAWWAELFGEVSYEEGLEALMWLRHQIEYKIDVTYPHPVVRHYAS